MNKVGEPLTTGAAHLCLRAGRWHVYRNGVAEYYVTCGRFGIIQSEHGRGDAARDQAKVLHAREVEHVRLYGYAPSKPFCLTCGESGLIEGELDSLNEAADQAQRLHEIDLHGDRREA